MLRHRTLARSKFLAAVGLDCLTAYATARGLNAPAATDDETAANWLASFADAQRASVVEDWQTINDIADNAVDCLDVAYRSSALVPDDDAPRERLAMRLFLEDRASFDMAADLYEWRDATLRMSHYRLSEAAGKDGLPDTADFEAMVSAHFQQSLRSDKCIVRTYEEAGVWIFLVAHGDYQQTQQRWSPEGPRPDFFRPARQDILQYNPTSGVFSMRIDGRPTREDQQLYVGAFSERCLGIPARELAELETTISLAPIRDGAFSYRGNEHIEWVRLAAADMRFDGGATAAVIRSGHVLAALESTFRGTQIGDADLSFVKLHMKVRGQRGRPRAVTLKPPSRSEISRDAAVIEAYLRQEGVLLA